LAWDNALSLWKDRPSWPGGVAAPEAQTGWWFKIHEDFSQWMRKDPGLGRSI